MKIKVIVKAILRNYSYTISLSRMPTEVGNWLNLLLWYVCICNDPKQGSRKNGVLQQVSALYEC